MKIRRRYNMARKGVTVSEIQVGTVFSGSIGTFDGLFLRFFSGVVSLGEPSRCWTGVGGDVGDLLVQDYIPHDVELVDNGPIEES